MLLTVESTQKIRTKINLSPDFHRVHYLRRMVDRDNEHVSSIQLLIHVQLFPTPWTAAHQASLPITNSRSLLKLKSIESVMPFNHFTLVVPFSSCLQSFPTSGFFSNELVLCIRWPKYWSFSFNISPSNDIQG